MKENQEFSGDIYKLFAHIFAKEPTADFLCRFQKEGIKELLNPYNIDPFADLKDLSVEKQADVLAEEYARLFLLPTRAASLHESLQRGEGRLWGDSAQRALEVYRKFGFVLDDAFKDMPDHLSAELSFLAELSTLKSEYAQRGLPEAEGGVLKVKRYFLKRHLLGWFFNIQEGVIKAAHFSYYKELAKLLGVFLNEEWERLRNTEDIS